MSTQRTRIVAGSCWTCRRRRIKCDLTKPRCERCRRTDQPCHFGPTAPIKWVGGMAQRGRLAAAHVALTNALLRTPSTHIEDTHLMLYYANYFLPRFQLSTRAIDIDLSLVAQDRPLQQAILAVSQAHHCFSSLGMTQEGQVRSRKARQLALHSFRDRLQTGADSIAAARELLTVNILLCMLDGIVEPFDQNASVYHLKGGFSIIKEWDRLAPAMLLGNELQTHSMSVFATMDRVHAILAGETPFFEPVVWYMFANVDAWWGRLPLGDRFFDLLKAFSEMAALGQWINSNADSPQLVAKCLPVVQSVLESRTFEDSAKPAWNQFCSLYEIAGTIYLRRALQQRAMDDEIVQEATERGIALLAEGLPGMLAHCVIFPTLIIGRHCLCVEHQQAVLNALSPTLSYLSFGSVQLMVDFLKQVWHTEDTSLSWLESFAPLSAKAFIF